MRKLTALFVASTLALGAANLAHAADTTTAAPADAKPMYNRPPYPMYPPMMYPTPYPVYTTNYYY